MSSEIAIKIENLSKCYHIYGTPRDRLKQFLLPRIQHAVGIPTRQYYREFWALNSISFEVKRGETVGIIGRNGSGKSTLLQIICGTLNLSNGSIKTCGRIAALLELGSGFNPEFTGRENVYLNGSILGLSKAEIDIRFDAIAAFADIGEFLDRPVKTYSSGMYVRLAFAVQAMVDPDILIIDEALAVGDEKFQRKCFTRLEQLKNNGTSILFVSHSSGSIIELCQKTLLLDHGTQIMFGSSPEAIRTYEKLLYAPVDIQEHLTQEASSESCLDDQHLIDLTKIENAQLADDYDPNLTPTTTTVYPAHGATIDYIQIINTEGQVVNALQPGKTYHFVINGRFLTNFSGVYFGIHIKSVSGVVVTGQRFPEEGRYLQDISANREFKVSFSFSMNLLPGVYFVGGGIWSSEEPICAHRILDAIMFRVTQTQSTTSFGYVTLQAGDASYHVKELR